MPPCALYQQLHNLRVSTVCSTYVTPLLCYTLQEVFLTSHHLAIAMEYAAGGDLSEYVQANKLPGVRYSRGEAINFATLRSAPRRWSLFAIICRAKQCCSRDVQQDLAFEQ